MCGAFHPPQSPGGFRGDYPPAKSLRASAILCVVPPPPPRIPPTGPTGPPAGALSVLYGVGLGAFPQAKGHSTRLRRKEGQPRSWLATSPAPFPPSAGIPSSYRSSLDEGILRGHDGNFMMGLFPSQQLFSAVVGWTPPLPTVVVKKGPGGGRGHDGGRRGHRCLRRRRPWGPGPSPHNGRWEFMRLDHSPFLQTPSLPIKPSLTSRPFFCPTLGEVRDPGLVFWVQMMEGSSWFRAGSLTVPCSPSLADLGEGVPK